MTVKQVTKEDEARGVGKQLDQAIAIAYRVAGHKGKKKRGGK